MKTAVITGGAGGLGRALSDVLLARGWHVVVLDLEGPALDACRDIENLSAYACDLTDDAATTKIAKQIISTSSSIDLVIYNVGVTQVALFADGDPAAHRKLFEINYFSAVTCARLFLHALRDAKGVHLAISSVAGFSPLFKRTAYSASKHALEGFFNSLRSEEKGHGVRVMIAAPSFVSTNIGREKAHLDGMSRPGSASDTVDTMTPDEAATAIIDGLERGKKMNPIGRVAKLSWFVSRISPSLFQRLMEKQVMKK